MKNRLSAEKARKMYRRGDKRLLDDMKLHVV